MPAPAHAKSRIRSYGLLLAILLLAFVTRMVAALDYGQDWYAPNSFTLINFDEAGSCRAALKGFNYSPWVGWQTLTLAEAAGVSVPVGIAGDTGAVKTFCHSEAHIGIARLYSVTTGTLTVAALWLLAVLLFPDKPGLAPIASMLLALSGWHISESLMGTVDAASTFFIYLFMSAMVWSVRNGGWRWLVAALLLVPAIWTKYWVFALATLAVFVPSAFYCAVFAGISRLRGALLLLAYAALFGLLSNPRLPDIAPMVLPFLFYFFVPWSKISPNGKALLLLSPWLAPLLMQLELFVAFTAGGLEGRFGTDYGAIGWHKWLRNPLNIPIVLLMGLGLPAFVLALMGLRRLWKTPCFDRVWLCLLPLLAFALYMLFLAPVTYYRHYLPLLPAACLLAALGLGSIRVSRRRFVLPLMLCWQAALAADLVSDYHFDPRRQLPTWYAEQRPSMVLASYYVSPPRASGVRHGLFRPTYALSNSPQLQQADAVILSENWYDTAFANELNGPLANDPAHLIKTTAQEARFYRQATSDEHPLLRLQAHYRAPSFMPELLLHYVAYGSFTQFVGDIMIFEIRK
ncbi:hypothetical protein R0135_10710 [Congregibacter variabilis]|uniref:Glycosyltransferase RgtA/B/C/D-like domain-containing protein n=1 Tax=Congregibacter variabilis TaxID=3081200 RepID=A0ABZ0HYF7_9GAMM|nr:hypothetical protein R0135_10710 [Congregibacter sp. IMCC43200]